jgi:uncharacterized protein (TIGR02246 family)
VRQLRSLGPVIALACAVATLPARSIAGQARTEPDTLPTVTLPPALDRVLRDYERAWRARDAAALAALFTGDGFVLSAGRPPVRGRSEVQARYTGQGGPLHLRAIAFAADDTVGYIIGTYGATSSGINEGKFVLALRRSVGGPWRIAADMDNSSQPMRR